MAAAIPRLADSSPTASLLRNSRLFSLPQPLPRPTVASQGRGQSRDSDSATTPYPTHQVIATTDASRARGDWGLKRPLPLKSTAASRGLRMRALDTYDQVTEFDSGLPHALTLKKLQELNLNVSRLNQKGYSPYNISSSVPPRNAFARTETELPSAFEAQYDHTAPQPLSVDKSHKEKFSRESKLTHRWRMRGPELKSLSSADFDAFVKDSLVGRQEEFKSFLKTYRVKEYLRPIAEEIHEAGFGSPNMVKELIKWVNQLSPPATESYLAYYCNSTVYEKPPALEQWLKPWSSEQTPAWMPPKPETPETFEVFAWQSNLAHRLIHGRRRFQSGEPVPDEETLELVEEDALGARELRLSRRFDKSSVDQVYTNEERQFVAHLLKQAQERMFVGIVEHVVLPWPTWLAEFRANSGLERDYRHLLEYFLDLPKSINQANEESSDLLTHPSAGVSYRRTSRSIVNHPIFGPLVGVPLTQARHVPSSRASRIGNSYAVQADGTGLAGLIVKTHSNWEKPQTLINVDKKSFDPETGYENTPVRGTAKKWMAVKSTRVRNDGHILVSAEKGAPYMELVYTKQFEQSIANDAARREDPLLGVKRAPRADPLSVPLDGLVKDGRVMEPLDGTRLS